MQLNSLILLWCGRPYLYARVIPVCLCTSNCLLVEPTGLFFRRSKNVYLCTSNVLFAEPTGLFFCRSKNVCLCTSNVFLAGPPGLFFCRSKTFGFLTVAVAILAPHPNCFLSIAAVCPSWFARWCQHLVQTHYAELKPTIVLLRFVHFKARVFVQTLKRIDHSIGDHSSFCFCGD